VAPPGGYNSNFFNGRPYGPQALSTDEKTVDDCFCWLQRAAAQQQSGRLSLDRPVPAAIPIRLFLAVLNFLRALVTPPA
jgi:hypothetical protein